MLSMTGYGSGEVRVGPVSVLVEARALNHRFLDVRVRLPPPLMDHAVVVDEIARKRLVRGRIELSVRLDGSLLGTATLDRERALRALRELQELRDELGASEPVPLSLLGVVPGLFQERPLVEMDALREGLQAAADTACGALLAMRRTEGHALAADMASRVLRIHELSGHVRARIGELGDAHRERLRGRVASLLEGTRVALDPHRLEQEVALLADRSDVSEEVTRLASHCGQFSALLAPGEEAVGRRLEFLLQEMGREVNTLGSKIADLGVTARVLELKSELERLREQVQNVL
jgi:uncharacterized protein (TIGR00255 family)